MAELTRHSGWIPNTDLSPLEPEQCKDVSEKGKTKSLIEAYKIAAEGHDLQHFKDMLMQHEAAIQEDEDRKAQRESEKAAKADKKKRKSEVKADDDVDMEDVDDSAPKKSSKKRKKDAESDDEEPEKASNLFPRDIGQLIPTNSLLRLRKRPSSNSLLAKLQPPTRRTPRRKPLSRNQTRKRKQPNRRRRLSQRKRKNHLSTLLKPARLGRRRCSSCATSCRKDFYLATFHLKRMRCRR